MTVSLTPAKQSQAKSTTTLSERMHEHHNEMPPCDADADWEPTRGRCEPLDLPAMSPDIKITWGDSICDCIESDDTEVMTITVCNPYSNIDYSSFTILKLEVVDGTGNPVASLPDGTPSVQLTPIGPHCFGAIERCTCISREFVLRNRGALAGEYRIRVTGICFDIHMHDDATACFKFDICED